MVTFIGFDSSSDLEDAGKALNRPRMKPQLGQDMLDSGDAVFGVFDSGTPYDAMDFITFIQKKPG